ARGAGVTVQSICQESFSGALQEIIRQIKSALGAACLPRQLNLEADGTVSCDVVVVMPEGMECNPTDGQSPQMVDGVAVREDGRAVCVMNQEVGDPTSAAAPSAPGWYYDYYTAEGRENCETTEGQPWQRIAFSAQPPPGAEVRLECF